MKTFLSKHADTIAAAIIVCGISLAILAFNLLSSGVSFTALTTAGVSYPSATVEQVVAENLDMEKGTGRYMGSQTLSVRITSGESSGEVVEAQNSLSPTHSIVGAPGERVILKADTGSDGSMYYTVFNYDRIPAVAALVVVFALSMVIVGGTKGVRSLVGLLFVAYALGVFLVPGLYRGFPAVPMGFITAAAITVVSMVLLNGLSEKTFVAIASTVAGLLAAAAVYAVFAGIMQVNGFNQDGADELIVVKQATDLDIFGTLFVSVLIASLGAVMDMCMSVATSLFEIRDQHPDISARQLMASGFTIGRDMIGTMCQTLILAFVGSSLTSLLLLISYGVQLSQLLSSDLVAVEIVHSFVGAIAVVLCVPVTSLICAGLRRRS